jgi:hypothetical protein
MYLSLRTERALRWLVPLGDGRADRGELLNPDTEVEDDVLVGAGVPMFPTEI